MNMRRYVISRVPNDFMEKPSDALLLFPAPPDAEQGSTVLARCPTGLVPSFTSSHAQSYLIEV